MEILPDLEHRLPGRGAYTCIDKRCLAAAITQKQFKRSFKHDVTVMPAEQLVEHIRQQLHNRITGLIGLAHKAGMITAGSSMVIDAVRNKKKPGFVMIAQDVSEAIGEKIIQAATVHHVSHRSVLTKDDFGMILGKAPKSSIAVASGGFVAQLVKAIDRYTNFLGEV
jgi:ribosomal protein L7Ae-like RNA K-turn-binding protein